MKRRTDTLEVNAFQIQLVSEEYPGNFLAVRIVDMNHTGIIVKTEHYIVDIRAGVDNV